MFKMLSQQLELRDSIDMSEHCIIAQRTTQPMCKPQPRPSISTAIDFNHLQEPAQEDLSYRLPVHQVCAVLVLQRYQLALGSPIFPNRTSTQQQASKHHRRSLGSRLRSCIAYYQRNTNMHRTHRLISHRPPLASHASNQSTFCCVCRVSLCHAFPTKDVRPSAVLHLIPRPQMDLTAMHGPDLTCKQCHWYI